MRQKVVIYGNCQAGALKNLFNSIESLQRSFNITNIPVHSIKPNQIGEVVEKVKQSKYFIYQPVGSYKGYEELSSMYLRKILSSKSKAISFPSIYFNGYTPHTVHLRKQDGSSFPSLQKKSNLHDRNILLSFSEGKTVEQTYEMITRKNFYNQELSTKLLNSSIKELERREKEYGLDIFVSDLILKNYQNYMLFKTVNHPTTTLLKKVGMRIANKIGINIGEEKKLILPDLLKGFSLYIYPSTRRNLNLKFTHHYYKYNNTKVGVRKSIEKSFAIYKKEKEHVQYALAGIKANDFVVKTFSLDLHEFITQLEKDISNKTKIKFITQLEKGTISRKQYVQNIYYELNKKDKVV